MKFLHCCAMEGVMCMHTVYLYLLASNSRHCSNIWVCLHIWNTSLIENPAYCEIRSVIRYLSAKGLKAVEIHHKICEVYGQNIMSDGMVRKWVRVFKDGWKNVHDEERSRGPSVISRKSMKKWKWIYASRFLQYQNSSLKFHVVFYMKLFPNVKVSEVVLMMGTKNVDGGAQNQTFR